MGKKYCLFFLFLFLITVSLFSLAMSEQSFRVYNYTNEDLIVNFEISDYITDLLNVDIHGINVSISWILGLNPGIKEVETKIRINDHQEIINYRPFPGFDFDEGISYYDELEKISLYEKMKVIMRTFSIRTTEGKYIIRDIDDLCSANIIRMRKDYVLEIYDDFIILPPNGECP